MSIPGFTAEASLNEARSGYRMASAHVSRPGEVVPQLTRLCAECSGRFVGTRICCDMEIIFCMPGVPCIVTYTNCQTESCGLLAELGGLLATW